MANIDTPPGKREFRCNLCNGKILIPWELPPTTGPCPHCGGVITSPAAESPPASAFAIPPAPASANVPQPPAVDTPRKPVGASPAAPAVPPAAAGEVRLDHPAPSPAKPVEIIPPPVPEAARKAAIPAPRPAPPSSAPPAKTEPARPEPAKAPEPPRSSGLAAVMLVLLFLILGAGGAVYYLSRETAKSPAPTRAALPAADPAAREANYIRVGWQKEAYQVLRDYMAATSSQGKLPFILNGESMATRLEDFYGGGVINDMDTPAEAFSIYELSEEDRKRGLFMMIYDQPPQFDMKEFFRPLAPLEVQYGLDNADLLLSTLARVGNFAMEPLRVHAFFKRTPAGLKLDWEIFAQTKYRTFQNFVEIPEEGQVGVFRVFIVEDVPEQGNLETGTRTYRIADPANTGDTARVNVKVDSETGRALSIINWRGTKDSRPITRTATVELKWTGDSDHPNLEIGRFICWEFLGLGGQDHAATASTQ